MMIPKPMNDTQLAANMVREGMYIMPRMSIDKRHTHALYSSGKVLVGKVSNKQFRRIKKLLKCRNEKYTLNLSLVRQLHGNSIFKQIYKTHKNVDRSNKAETGI